MKFRYGIWGQSRAQVWVCHAILCLFLSVQRDAFCQAPSSPSESDAKQMVVRLQSALEKNDTVQANQIGRELQALGKTALPAIRESLPACNKAEARQLTSILGGIGGSEATQLLMHLACQSPDSTIAAQAIHAIGNRPIDFDLTTNQFERLVAEVRKGHVLNAAAAAQLLARSQRNDKSQIVRTILERFIEEITSPTKLGEMQGSYLSPRVYTLNLFLLAFADMKDKAATDLKDALQKATEQDTQKWLILALGMCGDQSVAEDIRHLVENDHDIYFRSVAVRSYARSAKEEAMPVLQALLADSSKSEYDRLPDGSPVYPIRIAARDELVRLRSAKSNSADQ